MFDSLKNSNDSIDIEALLSKIIPVSGDISEEKLGLSDEDFKMLCDNVNIVVHCAATLDFETDLKTAVIINLLGTKRIVELCKQIKTLHVRIILFLYYLITYIKNWMLNLIHFYI